MMQSYSFFHIISVNFNLIFPLPPPYNAPYYNINII